VKTTYLFVHRCDECNSIISMQEVAEEQFFSVANQLLKEKDMDTIGTVDRTSVTFRDATCLACRVEQARAYTASWGVC
jgi:hypothetical protein